MQCLAGGRQPAAKQEPADTDAKMLHSARRKGARSGFHHVRVKQNTNLNQCCLADQFHEHCNSLVFIKPKNTISSAVNVSQHA
jgi:hypothetical protein